MHPGTFNPILNTKLLKLKKNRGKRFFRYLLNNFIYTYIKKKVTRVTTEYKSWPQKPTTT